MLPRVYPPYRTHLIPRVPTYHHQQNPKSTHLPPRAPTYPHPHTPKFSQNSCLAVKLPISGYLVRQCVKSCNNCSISMHCMECKILIWCSWRLVLYPVSALCMLLQQMQSRYGDSHSALWLLFLWLYRGNWMVLTNLRLLTCSLSNPLCHNKLLDSVSALCLP